VDVLFPPDKKLFYNDLTFDQVWEFKFYPQDEIHGLTSSGMFNACLACPSNR